MIRFRLTRDTGTVKTFDENETYEIYKYICEEIFNEDVDTCSYQTHQEAKGAQDWCDVAEVDDDEFYDGNGYIIEIIAEY